MAESGVARTASVRISGSDSFEVQQTLSVREKVEGTWILTRNDDDCRGNVEKTKIKWH